MVLSFWHHRSVKFQLSSLEDDGVLVDDQAAKHGSHPLSLRFNGHFPGEPGLAGVY